MQHQGVAERLRHFPAFDAEHAVVQPCARENPATVRAGRLRDFVFVMRKQQIVAAGVDVDRFAEVCCDHRRALDMPAGASAPPGTVPARQIGCGRFPQHEIGRVLLVRGDFYARAGDHFVGRAARQLAVLRERRDIEQHMTFSRVSMVTGDQAFAHGDDLRDMRGGVGCDIGRIDPELRHIFGVGGGIAGGDRVDRDAGLCGGGIDLVVDVGDIARVDDVIGSVEAPEQTDQQAEHHRPACIADMHVVVDRGAAQIHRHPGGVQGAEILDLARERIVQSELHR